MNEAWKEAKKRLDWQIDGPYNRLGSWYHLPVYNIHEFFNISQEYSNWWHEMEDLYGDEA